MTGGRALAALIGWLRCFVGDPKTAGWEGYGRVIAAKNRQGIAAQAAAHRARRAPPIPPPPKHAREHHRRLQHARRR